MEGDVAPIIVGVRKLACFCYLTVKLHDPTFIRLGTIAERNRQSDRQTDGIAVAITLLALCCRA